jgi:polyisoprenyl-teichoic acid--peptidoglycan teichoic acid transferase
MTFRSRLNRRAFSLAGAALSGAVALGYRLPAFARQAMPVDLPKKGAYTILVAGLDTRTVEDPENTDVIMISRVDLWTETVRTLSISRDLHLDIPGYGFDKINRAYDHGSKANDHDWNAGVALMTEMIETNFGLDIDAVVTVRFDGFAGVVDALGGVSVNNPYEIYEDAYPTTDLQYKEIYYPAGALTLNGEQALEFSRSRHSDSDEGRIMRQHLVLTALMDAAQMPERIWSLQEIAAASRQFVTTNLPPDVQTQLIAAVPYIYPANVAWGTITDYLWGENTPDGGWMYQADWTQLPLYVRGWLGLE